MSQARFQKMQREKAKRERLEAKRERKAMRAEQAAADEADESTAGAPPQETVLAQLAALHQRFDDDAIEFDEFEERKAELLAQLNV